MEAKVFTKNRQLSSEELMDTLFNDLKKEIFHEATKITEEYNDTFEINDLSFMMADSAWCARYQQEKWVPSKVNIEQDKEHLTHCKHVLRLTESLLQQLPLDYVNDQFSKVKALEKSNLKYAEFDGWEAIHTIPRIILGDTSLTPNFEKLTDNLWKLREHYLVRANIIQKRIPKGRPSFKPVGFEKAFIAHRCVQILHSINHKPTNYSGEHGKKRSLYCQLYASTIGLLGHQLERNPTIKLAEGIEWERHIKEQL